LGSALKDLSQLAAYIGERGKRRKFAIRSQIVQNLHHALHPHSIPTPLDSPTPHQLGVPRNLLDNALHLRQGVGQHVLCQLTADRLHAPQLTLCSASEHLVRLLFALHHVGESLRNVRRALHKLEQERGLIKGRDKRVREVFSDILPRLHVVAALHSQQGSRSA
jgi:hypothetical protein